MRSLQPDIKRARGGDGPSRLAPKATTDEEAEPFLDQDLADLDFTAFRPLTWEAEPKAARVDMRLPRPLTCAVKARAAERGIPSQRLFREAIERAVRQPLA